MDSMKQLHISIKFTTFKIGLKEKFIIFRYAKQHNLNSLINVMKNTDIKDEGQLDVIRENLKLHFYNKLAEKLIKQKEKGEVKDFLIFPDDRSIEIDMMSDKEEEIKEWEKTWHKETSLRKLAGILFRILRLKIETKVI